VNDIFAHKSLTHLGIVIFFSRPCPIWEREGIVAFLYEFRMN
jgi:hypothetical protein